MITLIILFSLVLSAGFAFLNRRRTTMIAIAAALVAFEAVGSGLIPSLLLETLQSRSIVRDNPAWGERNVIIVLGDGTVRFADLTAHEYIGMLRYYIYNFLGWNPSVSRSASP